MSKRMINGIQERAYEMRFIENTFVRTARREHKCRKCSSKIPVGSEYAEYVGEVGAYESGARYCLNCAATELVDTSR